jgi:GntR family transcriptional regulator
MVQIEQGVIPRYFQLKGILEKRLQSGEYQLGDKFPTDDELCQEYGLSRGTVRRAVEMLIDAGLLRREQGRGTFIDATQSSPVFFRLANFDEEMKSRGWKPSTTLVSRRVFPAGEDAARQLKIPVGGKVIEIVRLRLADDKPIAYETRCLDYKTCPQLMEEDLENQSVHSLLLDKFNIPLIRACYTIEARAFTQKEAKFLQVDSGSTGFSIERVTYTTDDKPVTWYRTIYRGDVYRFSAEF